jgi:hypothetical protein
MTGWNDARPAAPLPVRQPDGPPVQGDLVSPGHPIAASTVEQILHDAGTDPRSAPGPGPSTDRPTEMRVLSYNGRLALLYNK